MEDLNKDFWEKIDSKYPKETTHFLSWINGYMDDYKTSAMHLFRYQTVMFPSLPPSFQLGLFIQYTMQHENKQDWFRTKNHGTVTEQISRWFEVEHRRNSEPEKKHSVYPVFL